MSMYICPGSLKERISDYGSFGERSIRSRGTIKDAERDYDSLRVKYLPVEGMMVRIH